MHFEAFLPVLISGCRGRIERSLRVRCLSNVLAARCAAEVAGWDVRLGVAGYATS